jgi:hypothetical protein
MYNRNHKHFVNHNRALNILLEIDLLPHFSVPFCSHLLTIEVAIGLLKILLSLQFKFFVEYIEQGVY